MKSIRLSLPILSLFLLSLAYLLHNPRTSAITPEPYILDPNDLDNGELRFIVEEATANEAGVSPVHGCWSSSYYDSGLGYLIFRHPGVLEGGCHWLSLSEKNLDVTWKTVGTLDGTYELTTGQWFFTLRRKPNTPIAAPSP